MVIAFVELQTSKPPFIHPFFQRGAVLLTDEIARSSPSDAKTMDSGSGKIRRFARRILPTTERRVRINSSDWPPLSETGMMPIMACIVAVLLASTMNLVMTRKTATPNLVPLRNVAGRYYFHLREIAKSSETARSRKMKRPLIPCGDGMWILFISLTRV